jgi:release factor glutamine methyltransferase
MTLTLSHTELDSLVGELRAAGCVFAEDEARLLAETAASTAELHDLVQQRVGGEPLEYLLGWVEFFGLRVAIDRGVFVPRQRTAFLVREAIALAHSNAVILDLCCGSGAIGIAIASSLEGSELYASDIDPVATANARRNFEITGGRVFEGDLFDALPDQLHGRIDILAANVPYVPTDALELMPVEAREFEPVFTHDGGADGLDVVRRVAAEASLWLAPGGHLLIETSEAQAADAAGVFAHFGLRVRIAKSDHFASTVVVGERQPR